MTFSFFFIHCSKFFNFVFLNLSSSWWRGQWYPRTCHGFLFDYACWDGPWPVIMDFKERKGFFDILHIIVAPLKFSTKAKWESANCWLQASGASHTWYVIGGGAGETMYSTVEHTGLGEITWRANELVATLPRSTLGGNTAEIKIWAEVKIFGGKCSVVVHPTIKSSPESIFPFKMCTASPQWGLMRWCSFAFRLSDCRTICVSLLSYE
jgi:hypothetical protein